MRIAAIGGVRQAHPPEQPARQPATLHLARADAVDAHRFLQDLTYRKARIERGIGILENDLDPALIGPVFAVRHGQQVAALEQRRSTRRAVQAQQGQSHRGFSGTRLAHHAQRLAAAQGERDVPDRLEFALAEQAFAQPETLGQLIDHQHGLVIGRRAAHALLRHLVRLDAATQVVVDHRQAQRARIERRPAMQQSPCIRVGRGAEHLAGRTLLAHLAVAHHDHAVGDLAHQPQVVRDEQHRHAAFALQARD